MARMNERMNEYRSGPKTASYNETGNSQNTPMQKTLYIYLCTTRL